MKKCFAHFSWLFLKVRSTDYTHQNDLEYSVKMWCTYPPQTSRKICDRPRNWNLNRIPRVILKLCSEIGKPLVLIWISLSPFSSTNTCFFPLLTHLPPQEFLLFWMVNSDNVKFWIYWWFHKVFFSLKFIRIGHESHFLKDIRSLPPRWARWCHLGNCS